MNFHNSQGDSPTTLKATLQQLKIDSPTALKVTLQQLSRWFSSNSQSASPTTRNVIAPKTKNKLYNNPQGVYLSEHSQMNLYSGVMYSKHNQINVMSM